jgi:hypothetical protein
MDKSLIGDIQIHNSTTFIEIAANGVKQLLAEIKPEFLLEGKIDIKQMSTHPERIPMVRERKFSSSRRGGGSAGAPRTDARQKSRQNPRENSRENTRQNNRSRDDRDQSFKSEKRRFEKSDSKGLGNKRKPKKPSFSNADGSRKPKESSPTLKLPTSDKKETSRGGSSGQPDKNRGNKTARRIGGGKAPLRRRRSD